MGGEDLEVVGDSVDALRSRRTKAGVEGRVDTDEGGGGRRRSARWPWRKGWRARLIWDAEEEDGGWKPRWHRDRRRELQEQ